MGPRSRVHLLLESVLIIAYVADAVWKGQLTTTSDIITGWHKKAIATVKNHH